MPSSTSSHPSGRAPRDGLCACGCGQVTTVATRNHYAKGWLKGEHALYVHGHHARCKSPETIAKLRAALSGENNPMFGIRGADHPRFGGTHTAETRQKIRESKLGKRNPNYGKSPSLETRAKLRAATAGKNNPNWRGGINPPNERARRTDEYLAWRLSVLTRDDYTCQRCGKRGGDMHAHHVKGFAECPDLRLEITNGLTLCKPCHHIEHSNRKETPA